jgi:uncharacterized protein (DUF433 family)
MSSRAAPNVIGIGLYTIPETARLLGRHFNTVRSWVHQGLAPAPVHLAFGETTILSFHDLISLMVVRRLRDEGVPLRNIRSAEDYLRTEWKFPRPYATQRVLTDGKSVFVALEEGGFTSADRKGQETLAAMIKDILRDVSYDAETELATAWHPRHEIALRPDIQFGQPCIVGTRLTTSTVAELIRAGDAPDFVAETYSVPLPSVVVAVEFEEALLRQAA